VKTGHTLPTILAFFITYAPASIFANDADAESAPTRPGVIGPFVIESADGGSSIRFSLATQVLFRFDSVDGEDGRGNDYEFSIRRLRPVLTGSLGIKDLTYKLHLSLTPGALEFMDFYVDYEATPDLRVRAGIYKVPFTRYRIQSFQRLTLADWSITTGYFGAERQLGITLHNGFEMPRKVEYEVGVFTGQNTRASHASRLAGLYGEEAPNRSDLLDPEPMDDIHPEIVARVAWNTGGIDTRADTDFEGGPARVSVGASAAWDIRPDPIQDSAFRIAPEVLLKAYGFSMSAFVYLGLAQLGDGMKDTRVAMWGAQAQASYVFARRYELAIRYAFIQIDRDLRDLARDRADRIIDAEDDPLAKVALAERYEDVGTLVRRHELSAGFNVHVIRNQIKVQTDFSWLPTAFATGDTHDFRARAQLQVAF